MAERLDHSFAVFNSHINDASDKADKEFKAQFGVWHFEKHIQPYHEKGMMAIFEKSPLSFAGIWIALCTAYVNEGSK